MCMCWTTAETSLIVRPSPRLLPSNISGDLLYLCNKLYSCKGYVHGLYIYRRPDITVIGEEATIVSM